jgi:hypothetical protein
MLIGQQQALGIRVAPFFTYSQMKKLSLADADHLNTVGYQAMKAYINSFI